MIFVVPSNRLVEIVEGELRLRPAKPGSIAPSVDLLLETAAAAFGPGLIAVILTGSGSDGSAGAWQVKQAGGTVIIENPATALFPSMPGSIAPSLVDATADLESIGGVLLGILAADGTAPRGREAREFEALLDRIRERSGIDFSTYKTATIVRRLHGRMGATGHSLGGRLREAARARPGGVREAHQQPPDQGHRVLPRPEGVRSPADDHAADADRGGRRSDGRELRVWSAGCSTGEEAYSLAIIAGWRRSVTRARSLDVRDLRDGHRRGRRSPSPAAASTRPARCRRCLPDIRERYFARSDGGYEVSKSVRAMMTFGEHDLGARAPFPRIDLILCRNVLIYFIDADAARGARDVRLLAARRTGDSSSARPRRSRRCRRPFVQDHARLRIYRRLPGPPPACRSVAEACVPTRETRGPARRAAIPATRRDAQAAGMTEAAEALLLDLRVGVVVVEPRYDITRINTAARRMLGIHGAGVRPGLRPPRRVLPSTAVRADVDAALSGETSDDDPRGRGRRRRDRRFPVTSRRSCGRYVRQTGVIEGAVIELTDVSRGRTRAPGAARGQSGGWTRAAVREPTVCCGPTTS